MYPYPRILSSSVRKCTRSAGITAKCLAQQEVTASEWGAFKFGRSVQLIGCSEEAYLFPIVPDKYTERRVSYPDVRIVHTCSDYLSTRYKGVLHAKVSIDTFTNVVKKGYAVAIALLDGTGQFAVCPLQRRGSSWAANL